MSNLVTILLSTLSLGAHLKEANGKRADIYGSDAEWRCGDVGTPKQCVKGALTASGAVFDPEVPSIAISLPTRMRIRPTLIWLKTMTSKCTAIWVTDKKHPRFMIHRPWDVSPAAAKLLGFKGTSDYLHLCKEPV